MPDERPNGSPTDNSGVIAFVLAGLAAWWLSRRVRRMISERSDDAQNPDNAGVIAPPPLIFAVPLVATLLVNRKLGLRFLPDGLRRPVGLPLLAIGATLGFSFLREMRRAQTPVDPYKPVANLTTDGPFAYTRNPAYLGMAAIFSGVSALANSLPSALILPAVLAVIDRGVIEREERYLEGKFGDEYHNYKARVGRWL